MCVNRGGGGGGGGGGGFSGPMEENPAWKAATRDFTYTETVKGQYGKYDREKGPNVWRKGDKERVYVPRNAGENAGYVTKNVKDVYGRNSGEHNGWGYSATRPGNVGELTRFIDSMVKYNI